MKRKTDNDALIYRKMQRVMLEKRLFLRKGLSRDDLAREVLTNRTYITRALSRKGMNFARFVNAFRAQYAIEMMLSDKYRDMPQADIAEMCGFSHVQTMNRYIKKCAGSTACAMRSRVLADDFFAP